MRVYHLTWSSDDRHPLARTEAQRRALVRMLARVAGPHLVLFFVVDDHLHVLVLCQPDELARLSQYLLLALRALVDVPVSAPYVREVDTRRYLDNLADSYLFGQLARHGIAGHPATWSGSPFADLVGARRIEAMDLKIFEAIPRYRLRRAHAAVGLPDRPLEPATPDMALRLGPVGLVQAAAQATAADPALAGKASEVVRARKAAVELGLAAGLSSTLLASALGVSVSTVRRLARQGADPRDLRALRLWLAVEAAVSVSRGPAERATSYSVAATPPVASSSSTAAPSTAT